jgi:hypothetical protein
MIMRLRINSFSEQSQHGCRKGDTQRRRTDRQTDLSLGRVEHAGKQREEWLDAVQVDKREHAAQKRRE